MKQKSKSRKEKKWRHPEDDVVVSGEDLVFLLDTTGLPYLKSIELTKLKPQQFELDKWKPAIQLSNLWMKKIYRDEVYRETESPIFEVVPLNRVQKKQLQKHLREQYMSMTSPVKKTKRLRSSLPEDNLVDILELPADPLLKTLADNNQSDRESSKIALVKTHKYLPEDMIVKLALQRMKNSSPEEEETYQRLLKDEEFMKQLNKLIDNHIKDRPSRDTI